MAIGVKMAKITLYPSSIKQPNANQKISIKKWCFKEVRRGGKVYPYGCSSPDDPRYYHKWSNTKQLKSGKRAQCGRPSTQNCSHKTSHNIKGYRNTCPIAGCNGTYNTPATLQLVFDKTDLIKKGLSSNSKIKQIDISFKHRCMGVDVANGKEYSSWGPNFYGYDKYPSLKVLKLFFTNSKDEKVSKTITTDSNGNDFSNPPLGDKYGRVTASFDDITLEDIQDGALNIIYGRNLSTNPGNIYIKDAKIVIHYSDAQPTITATAKDDEIYTADRVYCQTTTRHTITVGYKHGDDWIKEAKAPKTFTKNDIEIVSDDKVSVTYLSQTGRNIVYSIRDASNIGGTKKITYKIKGTKKSATIEFESIIRKKPKVYIDSKIKQNLSTDEISTSSLVINDGCSNDIKIYADNAHGTPIEELDGAQMTINNDNLIKSFYVKSIIQKISQLSCGAHTIFFRINNELLVKKRIVVVPRQYKFNMCVSTVPDRNRNEFNFFEGEAEILGTNKVYIQIQRIDDEDIAPTFIIHESVTNKTQEVELARGTKKSIAISTATPGNYQISVTEKQTNNSCRANSDIRNITIRPNHKQSHDFIFVRGEDGTSFEYDYLVGWEGDNIQQPIGVDNIELISSYKDIQVCVDKTSYEGISKTGLAKIKVKNISHTQQILKNIKIELNVLDQDKIVTTDEFFETNGLFKSLNEDFKIYNKNILTNVSLENLSEDNDLEDEENVYVNIKELEYNKEIIINIPYRCKVEKTAYIELLLFGNPISLKPFLSCNSNDTFRYMEIRTYDSALTDMEIISNDTDLLSPNIGYNIISGATENQCPNECFITKTDLTQPISQDNGGITYRIRNIDSIDIPESTTIIKNDINLIPIAFFYKQNNVAKAEYINESYTPNTANKVYWNKTTTIDKTNIVNAIIKAYIKFPNDDDKQILIQRTNSNGDITFVFQIPETSLSSYTIETLIRDVVCIEYEGNDENKYMYIGSPSSEVSNKISQLTSDKEKRINQLQTLSSSLPDDSTQKQLINQAINDLKTDKRNDVDITYQDTYRKYKPGDIVELHVNVKSNILHENNNIVFKPEIKKSGDIDEVTVFYKICNLKNNEGILNTSFETNSFLLIPNKISKDIYCGVETVLYPKVSIEKRIVEQSRLNFVHIWLYNEKRNNHDIVCDIDLGPYPEGLKGKYDFITINIDDGDYNVYTDDSSHLHIEWNVGEMQANTESYATISIRAEDIGLSEILINTFDFLHDGTAKQYHFRESQCDCQN